MNEKIIMQHDDNSIRKLAKVQDKVFYMYRTVIEYILCIIFLLLGVGAIYDIGTPYRYLLLAAGAMFIANIGFLPKYKADKVIRAIQHHGCYPKTGMQFFKSYIAITEYGNNTHSLQRNYNCIEKMVEDADYFYLFLNNRTAYMIPKNQIRRVDEFKQFLEERTNINFRKTYGIFSFRLSDLIAKLK